MLRATLQILLLAGSVEYPSRTRATLEIIADMLKEQRACPRLWDLAEEPLPMFNPRASYALSTYDSEAVHRFLCLAEEADAFVWASPNYHNSFSGALKNALDHLTIHHCRNKAVTLVSAGKSERTGTQPCDQLRLVARGLHAIAIPSQVVTAGSDFEYTQSHYALVHPAICERLAQMVDELLVFAHLAQQLREPLRTASG